MATAGLTPWAVSPWKSADGRVEASPRIIKVKKMPMESTCAEELKVPAMPAPAPR